RVIREARETDHMTQEQLALKTGIHRSFIARIERGEIDIRISTLCKIFEEGFERKVTINIS
ncbi:MAG: helix-turn-helix transcriptional regulator, partial [bacterium]|nr:helix-turn-helix transcriptional regulator [bacterium]